MKKISLTQGQIAIVDDDDFARLGNFNWCAIFDKKMNCFYAGRNIWNKTTKKTRLFLLHRVITATTDPNVKVDHKNRNTLDNRRKNLRVCTVAQNGANRRGAQKNSKSGIRGVCWHKAVGKWTAKIVVDKKHFYLGVFSEKADAAAAYASANRKNFGEFGGRTR